MHSAHSTGLAKGTTILLGDGAYFDFARPDATEATIEDYAWGLAAKGRFSGQTRSRATGKRCVYTVLQHVVELCCQMVRDNHEREACFEGLMHESDEVVGPDFPSTLKPLLHPDTKSLFALCGTAFDLRFGVTGNHHALVKDYDLRMLATEKRDLMPGAEFDPANHWHVTNGVQPFPFTIEVMPHEYNVANFIALFRSFGPRDAL